MTAFLKSLLKFLQMFTLVATLYRESKLRKEGERRLREAELEATVKQQRKAHEIEKEVSSNGVSTDAAEWLRKYQRESR